MCAAAFRDAAAMASAQGGGAEDALERLETDVMAELEKVRRIRYIYTYEHTHISNPFSFSAVSPSPSATPTSSSTAAAPLCPTPAAW